MMEKEKNQYKRVWCSHTKLIIQKVEAKKQIQEIYRISITALSFSRWVTLHVSHLKFPFLCFLYREKKISKKSKQRNTCRKNIKSLKNEILKFQRKWKFSGISCMHIWVAGDLDCINHGLLIGSPQKNGRLKKNQCVTCTFYGL